ncbi:MAG: isocitrate lyase/phosphoenolpyruvate mutase family protein, partial [Bacteroidia bacterium]|nr:isocitrate lyase/phosphoenolpyruvate mutase family protein [Bacteroidia bacterium]
VTGAGVASSRLGMPDIGLTTMTEVLETARSIVNTTTIPVICDADAGYGNALNLMRTVEEFERTGVAAIQVEDQVTPKRCGHTEGKQLIPENEMIKKIEAFCFTRKDNNFLLIARTDAIAVNGFDDAIARAKAYAKAGADVIFVEAPRTDEELRRIPQLLGDVPVLVNIVDGGGKTPLLRVNELEALGYRIAIFPTTAWMAAIKGVQGALKELKEKGTTNGYSEHMIPFEEIFEVVGLSHYKNLERKFL